MLAAPPGAAAEKFAVTGSRDQRDGFQLAVAQRKGRLACSVTFPPQGEAEDAVHENAAAIAKGRRYASVHIVTSGGGVEAAFRRRFTGRLSVAGHDSGTLERIRKSGPDAVYAALPPQALKSFLQAYDQAGLFHRIPVIAPDHDGRLARTLGAQFAGLTVSTRWSPDDDSDESLSFVRSFRKRYGRTPTASAMQGYQAAMMLAGAQAPEWHAWEIFTDARGAAYLAMREPTIRVPAAVPTCPAKAAPPPTSSR